MIIQDFRKKLNMSQSEFAKKFRIPIRTLQDWEQGRRYPPVYVGYMIQRIMDLEEFGGGPRMNSKKNNVNDDIAINKAAVETSAHNMELYLSGENEGSFEERRGEKDFAELADWLQKKSET